MVTFGAPRPIPVSSVRICRGVPNDTVIKWQSHIHHAFIQNITGNQII